MKNKQAYFALLPTCIIFVPDFYYNIKAELNGKYISDRRYRADWLGTNS